MRYFDIMGMSCSACSARVEKAVSKLDGVSSCSVNLLTNSMAVEGEISNDAIINAVKNAGYSANLQGQKEAFVPSDDPFSDKETPRLLKRLWGSLLLLLVLMYVAMGHTMFSLPLPEFFTGNPIAIGLLQLLLTIGVMIINGKFFTNGFKSLFTLSPNMDTLVAIGSLSAFIYSTAVLFAMTSAQLNGDFSAVGHYLHGLYFESSAMILTLITLGKTLEARAKGKTTSALKSLMDLAPKTALIIKDGKETEIPLSQIQKGDIFIVKTGMAVPADGVVIEGHCAIDEASLTGESIPVDKTKGDLVSSATVNKSGYIRCQATRVGEDTALSQIIKTVNEASATKAPIAKIADRVSGVFVPVVMGIALFTAIMWLILGEPVGTALSRGIAVLVISCPCALGLATPVAIMLGSGKGAKNGILFKTAQSLEETGKIKVVALDKTGTITRGEPEVTDIIPLGITENELLTLAYSLEKKSEHPLAKAIVAFAEKEGIDAIKSRDFSVFPGNGLTALINNKAIYGGNLVFAKEKGEIPENVTEIYNTLTSQGKTPLFFGEDNTLLGIIGVSDTLKEDSASAIDSLKAMGIHIAMLTGDNEKTANAVKALVGIDEVFAGVMPTEKAQIIEKLKERGRVAMVGDGINDAVALTSADIGIAIGAGTDIAAQSADIVLMKNRLTDVAKAIRLSRKTLINIKENLFWAFVYNIIGIPLAMGALVPVLGIELSPMFGAAAMSLSSFCVVTNALRLGRADIKISEKENKKMEKTLKIEGMMCPHCEGRVKDALEALEGVEKVVASHEKGTAVITLSSPVSDPMLKETVTAQGYTVID